MKAILLLCVALLNVQLWAVDAKYSASFRRGKIVIKEKPDVDNASATMVTATCTAQKESEQGATYACKDDSGYNGHLVILNYRSDSGVIIAKIPDAKARIAFSCKLNDDKSALKQCVLADGRKAPGRNKTVSPFLSEVEGLDLPNAAWLRKPSKGLGGVLRGMNPQTETDFTQLADIGINKVLIFKSFSESARPDLENEISGLAKVGLNTDSDDDTEDDFMKVPFPYYDFGALNGGYQSACTMVVDALTYIEEETKRGNNVFFHCTYGEDRTGLLSALFKLLQKPNASTDDLFEQHMCDYGYEAGNAFKPGMVNNNIRRDLTPLYAFVADQIKDGVLSKENLSKEACENAEAQVKTYRVKACKPSSRLYVYQK